MRRGCMGMMLKPRCNRRSGLEMASSTKKSGWVGQRSRWCWLCFWLERHCLSRICNTWSDGKQTVVPASFSAFEGCCAQEEPWIVVPNHPILRTSPQQTFSCFPNLKPLWKDVVSKPEEIQENEIRELRASTESAFQEAFQLGRNVGNGVSPGEGTALKETVLKMLSNEH